MLRRIGGVWHQVESITFGWCDREKALDYIRRSVAGEFDDPASPFVYAFKPQFHSARGHCELCA